MNPFNKKYVYVTLVMAILLFILGGYLFITNEDKSNSQLFFIAGGVQTLLFFISYFRHKKNKKL